MQLGKYELIRELAMGGVDRRVEVKAVDVTDVHLELLSDADTLLSGEGSDSRAR